MLDSKAFHRCAAIVSAEDFITPEHQTLWRLLALLVERDSPIDPVTINELAAARGKQDTIGGHGYAIELANNTPGPASAAAYAEIVRDHSIGRRMRQIGSQIASSELVGAFAIEEASRLLQTVQRRQRAYSTPLTDVLLEVYKRMCEREDGAVMPSTPAPLRGLNRKLGGGWGHGHLIIIAGRPGSGKTAFARDCAMTAAERGPVCIISLEMNSEELGGMMLAKSAGVSYQAIRDPAGLRGDWAPITAGMAKLRLPIHICDQSSLSLEAISSEARRLHSKGKLSMLVIDYLGLVDLPQAERNDIAIGTITRGLKRLAKELQIPVLLLCQLSRKVEERGNKRPMLSDLRDAGQIEQDADVVVMLYRDKYYDPESVYGDVAEINIAKQRHGETGVIPSVFIGERMTFAEYEGGWPIATQAPTPTRGFFR